jgi:hypothetical protein
MKSKLSSDLKRIISNPEVSDILKCISHGERTHLDKIPNLDSDIYELLPPILIGMLGKPDHHIKRDLRLLGLLVIISGVLPNLIGVYDNNEVRSNLNLFVAGPFAAGKGELNKLKQWVELIQKHFEEQYKQDMINYRQSVKDGEEDLKAPVKKWLFIPADNSKSGFIELLAQSDGRGILLDTEADTLTSTFSLEFGNYSDVLRKVYHHETVSFYRRTNKEKIEIEHPCLSVVIGGTSDQFEKMFFNSSNGLLSRFLVYNVRPIQKFKNVFTEPEEITKQSVSITYKQWILDNYLRLSNVKKPEVFTLSTNQQQLFVEYFALQKNLVSSSLDDEDSGFINRLALNIFKIMMILTSIRLLDETNRSEVNVCNDTDFYCAIKIYEMLREHFFYSFNELLQEKKKFFTDKDQLRSRISNLRIQYSYRKISKMLGIPLSTIHRISKGY